MTGSEARIQEAATAWFARLRDSATDEAAWLSFRDWLEADDRHRQAYASVEALWLDLDEAAERQGAEREETGRFSIKWRAGAAAGVAVMLGGGLMVGYGLLPDHSSQTYRAPPNAPRTLALADGSQVVLDRGSELKVGLHRRLRSVELVEGEASFQVTHDADRPFVVAAGEKSVRVLGTEFDVLRHQDRLRVTVTRGLVAVGPRASEHPDLRLAAGEQYDQHGAAGAVKRVDPADVAGWNRGLLIYRDAPLADVAADIGRYAGVRIRVADSAQAMNFSGVLKIADGRSMLDRLQAFLPLETGQEDQDVVLSRKAAAGAGEPAKAN